MTYEDLKNLEKELSEVYSKRSELYNMKDELRKKIREIEDKIAPDKEMINNFENQVKDRWTEIEQCNQKEKDIKKQMSVVTYKIYFGLTKDGLFQDEDTIAFRSESWENNWENIYLYQDDELKVYYKYTQQGNEVLHCDSYYKTSYQDRLDELKDEAYNNDNFLRRMRVDDIENNYCNDSLEDFLSGVILETVDYDELEEDKLEDNYALNELDQLEDKDWYRVFDSQEEYFELNKSEDLWILS